LGIVDMKTVLLLLILGLVAGFVIPYYLREIFSGAGVQLPQFWFSKSPPRSFSLNLPMILESLALFL